LKSSFGCKIEAKLSIPDFKNASIVLSQIANKVATESKKNIRTQTNVDDNSAFKRLSVKTIKDKTRENAPYPHRALYRKGVMYNAVRVSKIADNIFTVGILPRGKPNREMVAIIHHEETAIKRRFLGISSQTFKWAKARMDRWFKTKRLNSVKKTYSYNY